MREPLLRERAHRRWRRHAHDAERVHGLESQGELAMHPERVAEHALHDPRRDPAQQPELEAAAERMTEQAHLLDAHLFERELQAVDGVVERPPARHGEQVGDDDAGPIGEEAGHRQVGLRLHAVPLEQQDRRAGAEVETAQRTSLLVVPHATPVSTGRRRGPISKNVGTFSNS